MLLLILAVVFSLRTFGSGAFIPVAAPLPPSDPTATHLDSCRREKVAFQVTLAGPVDFSAIVSMGDLRGPGRIPHDSIRIFVQEPIAVSSVHPPQGSMPPGFYYDRLTPLIYPASIQVTPRQHRALWVDVSVPRGTMIGDYVGALIVRAGNVQTVRWVRLHVHDIVITEPSIPFIVGFSEVKFKEAHRLDRWDSPQGLILIEKYLQMANEHGIVLFPRGFLPRQWQQETGEQIWENYDRIFGPAVERSPVTLLPHQSGFRGELDSPDDSLAIGRWFGEVARHWKVKGWPLDRGLIWIYDEPSSRQIPPALLARYARIVRNQVPGIRIMVTESVEDSLYLSGGEIIASRGNKLYPPEIEGLKREGRIHKAFAYQSYGEPSLMLESIHSRTPGFRGWGAVAWKYRSAIDGMFFWSVNAWHPTSPLTIPDGGEGFRDGQGVAIYPGPFASIRLRRIRRAVQDLALLEMAPVSLADSVTNTLIQSALCNSYDATGIKGWGTHYCPPKKDPRWIDQKSDWEQSSIIWDQQIKRLRRR